MIQEVVIIKEQRATTAAAEETLVPASRCEQSGHRSVHGGTRAARTTPSASVSQSDVASSPKEGGGKRPTHFGAKIEIVYLAENRDLFSSWPRTKVFKNRRTIRHVGPLDMRCQLRSIELHRNEVAPSETPRLAPRVSLAEKRWRGTEGAPVAQPPAFQISTRVYAPLHSLFSEAC